MGRSNLSLIAELAKLERPSWKCRMDAILASGVPTLAAPGADGGGGAAAGTGAAGGTAPGVEQGGGDPGGTDDPYGLGQLVQGTPEHLRPFIQQHFETIRPQLDQRFSELQGFQSQWQPVAGQLEPLMQPADPQNPDGGTLLDGLIDLYEMSGDPARGDEFENWWEQTGNAFGFFAPDGAEGGLEGDQQGGEEGQQQGGEELAGLPPEVSELITGLRDQVSSLEQRLDGTDEQSQLQQAERQVSEQLQALMGEHGVQDDPELPPEQAHNQPSSVILRLASTYDSDDAVQRGVADYLALTGRAQGQMITDAGHTTTGLEGLGSSAPSGAGGGGRHAPALDGGSAAHEPENVGSWSDAKRIAMQRLRDAEAAGV